MEAMRKALAAASEKQAQMDTRYKESMKKMEQTQQELEQRYTMINERLSKELEEAHQCNEELLDIFSNMDKTMQQKEQELKLANERIQALERMVHIDPDKVTKVRCVAYVV
jgi:uncharacterized protein (DUF3084 family)